MLVYELIVFVVRIIWEL